MSQPRRATDKDHEAARSIKPPAPGGRESTNPKAVTPDDSRIAGRIRSLREARGLSRAYVGQRIGVSGTQLGNYELGNDRVPASRLLSIGRVLDVSLSYFLGDEALRGLSEPEQAMLEPKLSREIRKLVAEFEKINSPTLQRLAIELVAGLAKQGRREHGSRP